MADHDEVDRGPRDRGHRDLRPQDARALYGPGRSEDERRAVAERVRGAARLRAEAPAPRRAHTEVEDPPDAEPVEAGAQPDAAPEAPRSPSWRRGAAFVPAAVLVAAVALAGGYAIGAARQEPGRAAAGAPTPSTLPTVLYLDDRDGEIIHLEYRRPGDPRSVQARLPEMLAGWSMATACLSRTRRPRTVPTETVLLLDGAGRQLDSWTVPCDTAERRYFAIPAPARPTTVQLIVTFDDRAVSAAWATIDPNR